MHGVFHFKNLMITQVWMICWVYLPSCHSVFLPFSGEWKILQRMIFRQGLSSYGKTQSKPIARQVHCIYIIFMCVLRTYTSLCGMFFCSKCHICFAMSFHCLSGFKKCIVWKMATRWERLEYAPWTMIWYVYVLESSYTAQPKLCLLATPIHHH